MAASLPPPLRGLRVLDLTRVLAGPYATELFGQLGAEVIKIEAIQLTDARGPAAVPASMSRFVGYPNNDPGERPWNRGGHYNNHNRNKLSLTLNLLDPAAVAIFKRLAKISDVVIENYSPRVMRNFGLDYPVLSQLNPQIIMCSMAGFGTYGPQRDFVAFGPSIEAASGLCSLMGYQGGGAYKEGPAYCDLISGISAAAAVLTALWYRQSTGRGQYLDQSQAESSTAVAGDAALGYLLTGRLPERQGNGHMRKAPHGCYRCAGDDNWLVVAVGTEDEWRGLLRALGSPAWGSDPRFADAVSRWHHRQALDAHIEEWTRGRDHHEAMRLLQQAGVPAGAVLKNNELLNDPHLAARGYFVEIEHPEAGRHLYAGMGLRFSKSEVRHQPAPLLGQHNEYVLSGLLHLSGAEVRELEARQVIGTMPLA